MYIKRSIEDKILEISNNYPVLMLTGPRQVGKTTLLKHLKDENRGFVTLDILENRQLAVEEPVAFLEKFPAPVIIDEFQYAPNLLPYIKAYVDEHDRYGDFWLTGSQMFESMKGISESLAGRVGIVNLFGLSNGEINKTNFAEFSSERADLLGREKKARPMTTMELFERIHKGSMPRIYKEQDRSLDVGNFYASYLQTYISRDVHQLAQVGDELSFYKFMQICAAHTATMLNYNDMANEAGISAHVLRKWLSVLISSGILILLQPYYHNSLKRIVKTPKMYFMDTGLAAYLSRWENARVLEAGAKAGDFFETFVVGEVYKSFINRGKIPPLYYYRDENGRKEIDLLVERNGMIDPIEIKKSSNPDKRTLKNFDALDGLKNSFYQVNPGNVICTTNSVHPIMEGHWAIPAWLI